MNDQQKPQYEKLGNNGRRIDYKGLTVICYLNPDGSVRFDAYDHNEQQDVCKDVLKLEG